MKYYVSWNEDQLDLNKGFVSRSLIKTFLEVYGVRDFVIYSKKYCIVGSNWISNNDIRYDLDFYFMIRSFLTEKQVIKFSRKLTKDRLDFYKHQIKICKKYDDLRLNIKREDKSYNELIKEKFNA